MELKINDSRLIVESNEFVDIFIQDTYSQKYCKLLRIANKSSNKDAERL